MRVVRRRGDLIITETRHGFICANSGIDLSNVERGYAALLPIDSDRSARRIRDIVRARLGVEVGVIVSDTFGRPWRRGLTDVAIGVAGIAGVVDLRGLPDALGRTMHVTEVAVADELASAAELVMGKSAGIPVAVVRGADPEWFRDAQVAELIRPPAEDLFRCARPRVARDRRSPLRNGQGVARRERRRQAVGVRRRSTGAHERWIRARTGATANRPGSSPRRVTKRAGGCPGPASSS